MLFRIILFIGFPPGTIGSTISSVAKILQFDVDPAEINKNIQTDASVIGDIKEILKRVNHLLEQQEHTEWMQQISEFKEKYPLTYKKEGLSGPFVMEEIYRQTKGDAIIVTEVGQHQMWAAQYYKYSKPRTLLTSGGLGTMGYGLGAAIGAQVANPEKQVINIAGDGCFRMNMNEIATAVRQQLPLIQIVINNQVLFQHNNTSRNRCVIKQVCRKTNYSINITGAEQFFSDFSFCCATEKHTMRQNNCHCTIIFQMI